MRRHGRLIGWIAAGLLLFAAGRLSKIGDGHRAEADDIVPMRSAGLAGAGPVVVDLYAVPLGRGLREGRFGRQPFRYGPSTADPGGGEGGPGPDPDDSSGHGEDGTGDGTGHGTGDDGSPRTDGLRYLGSFGTEATRIAVVRSGDRIATLRTGEPVGDGLVVGAIGFASLAITSPRHPDKPPACLRVGGGTCFQGTTRDR